MKEVILQNTQKKDDQPYKSREELEIKIDSYSDQSSR